MKKSFTHVFSLLLIAGLLFGLSSCVPASEASQAPEVQATPEVRQTDADLSASLEATSEPEESAAAPGWDLSLPPIKDVYADYFMLGNIMEPAYLNDGRDTTDMFIRHFDVLTAENAMKPNQLSSAKGSYNFTKADQLIEWAFDNGIAVHGHALVWHSQSSAWLNTGDAANRTSAKENLSEYITTVAGHFAGKLISWDVVNEAFSSGAEDFDGKDWRTGLRTDSPWYIAYENGADITKGESGADYIYESFVLARAADPDAMLYFNDFNEEIPSKREAIALMVEELNEKWKSDPNYDDRLLIEGIGMQSHYWGGSFNLFRVDDAIARFAKTGARISISELDMPMGTWNEQYSGERLTPAEEKIQATNYAKLMLTYKKYAEYIDRVTFWGMADSLSWRGFGMPLPFDNDFHAKQALAAVMEPENHATIFTPGG